MSNVFCSMNELSKHYEDELRKADLEQDDIRIAACREALNAIEWLRRDLGYYICLDGKAAEEGY